jgi:hypothetical protein
VGVIQPVLAGARGRWSNPCFQILGLDVLLDEGGHPWLIEINDHPSLRVDLTLEEHKKATGHAGMPSAVDEAVKLPMLRDAMRLISGLHGLHGDTDESEMLADLSIDGASATAAPGAAPDTSSTADAVTAAAPTAAPAAPAAPAATAAAAAAAPPFPSLQHGKPGRGAYGTSFHEISPTPAEVRHLQLLARLRDIFELHSPSSVVFEATWGDAQREDAQTTSSAGPRWRAATFSRFVQAVGLTSGHRASAVAAGLSRPDADMIFASVCGKGGTMDVLDFAEALSRVASRLYPEGAAADRPRASPTELIERLLAHYFARGAATAPASARAATAARAAAVSRAATAARVAGRH